MTATTRWPRTLTSRLSLIFLLGLTLAYGLSFGSQFYERYQSWKTTMLGNLESDISTSIAVLNRLPAAERTAWLPRFNQQNYRYLLNEGETNGVSLDVKDAPVSAKSIMEAIGQDYPLTFTDIPGTKPHYQVHLRLNDGNPVTIDVKPTGMPLALWLPLALLIQLGLLLGCTWLAVRTAIRPLTNLAQAADALDPNTRGPRMDESGPTEVANAAAAFNAMQDRIAVYVKERMQILAAVSHDLQTPITRMKLRAEFAEDSTEKDKLLHDLNEIEHLVREGIAYAKSIHGAEEPNRRIDLDSFLDSLVFDYQDMDKNVQLCGKSSVLIDTRPHALRRVLVNLTDNALKFAGAAEIEIRTEEDSTLSINVLDRGPGIANENLAEVLKPFYRVESSRNRDTGGAGLGLAIAQQLAIAIGGSLTLSNREGGGLRAQLRLPV